MKQDYPHIKFRPHWLLSQSTMYELGECHAIITAIGNIPITPEQHKRLLNISLTKGAQATTAIEGNTLTEEEVDRIREGGTSLPPSKQYQEREVRNILTAFNQIFAEVAVEGKEELLTPDLLKNFHQVIGQSLGEHFDAIPGQFRKDSRIVGAYRCPDWRDVEELVAKLCRWLETEFHFRREQSFAEAIVEAIVSHIYIEWIHPFGDGNGRTGRLVEFYFLLRAGTPDIASHILSNHYNETRPVYYRQIDQATKTQDLSDFIAYAVQGFRDGLLKTLEIVQAGQFQTAWRQYVYDKFRDNRLQRRDSLNRQRDLALAMPLNLWLGLDAIPLLTTALARQYAQLSERTLLRDLLALQKMKLVIERRGEYRSNCDQLLNQTARRAQRKLLRVGEQPQPSMPTTIEEPEPEQLPLPGREGNMAMPISLGRPVTTPDSN